MVRQANCLPGALGEESSCKRMFREEDKGGTSGQLTLTKCRITWPCECQPGQRSIPAYFPFCELGAQQDPSLEGQLLAQAGRSDNTEVLCLMGLRTDLPTGKQGVAGGALLPQLLCHIPHSGRCGTIISPPLCTTMANPASNTSDH